VHEVIDTAQDEESAVEKTTKQEEIFHTRLQSGLGRLPLP
jgi:hypothetical protein